MTVKEQMQRKVEEYTMAIKICERSAKPNAKLLDMLKTGLIETQKCLLKLKHTKAKVGNVVARVLGDGQK